MILDEDLVIAVGMAGPTVSPIAVRFSYIESRANMRASVSCVAPQRWRTKSGFRVGSGAA